VNFLPLIEAKRDGKTLSAAQIKEMVAAYVAGKIPDYQMAAFLMAVYFRGLRSADTSAPTLAMRESRERLQFPDRPRPLVDEHATGRHGRVNIRARNEKWKGANVLRPSAVRRVRFS